MSAFQVPTAHIEALLLAAQSYGSRYGGTFSYYWKGREFKLGTPDQLNKMGHLLWSANSRSVELRYPEDRPGLPGAVKDKMVSDLPGEFVFQPFRQRIPTPVETLKICNCYAYQACEPSDWSSTQAAAFIDRLRDYAIEALPGYEVAPWRWSQAGRHSHPTSRVVALTDGAFRKAAVLIHDSAKDCDPSDEEYSELCKAFPCRPRPSTPGD